MICRVIAFASLPLLHGIATAADGEGAKVQVREATDTVGFASGGLNTVPGIDQIRTRSRVRFEGKAENGGLLVVGSSFAWHGPNKSLGWHGDWGMAATARTNDLAHVLWRNVRKIDPSAALCIAQSAYWERNYTGDVELLEREYADAAAFRARWIVVVSTGANAPRELAAREPLGVHYERLLRYFTSKNPKASVAVAVGTSGPAFRKDILSVAGRYGYPVVDMYEVLSVPGMRATGLFEHKGVASHPSDSGMSALAARFAAALNLGK